MNHHETYYSNPLQLLKPAWEALRSNVRVVGLSVLGFVAVIILMIVGLSLSLDPHLNPQRVNSDALLIIGLAVGAVTLLVLAGLFLSPFVLNFLLHSARGQQVGFRQAFHMDSRRYWRVIGAELLTGLTIMAGFILFIIPGVIFTAWFLFSSLVALDENLTPVAAMKRSRQLVRGHMTETFALLLLPTAVSIVGLIPLLGFLITLAFSFLYLFVTPLRYIQLKWLQDGDHQKPKLNGWNYAIIVAGLLFGTTYETVQYHNFQQLQPDVNPQQTQTTA